MSNSIEVTYVKQGENEVLLDKVVEIPEVETKPQVIADAQNAVAVEEGVDSSEIKVVGYRL